jgi:hypothetical protein
MLDLQANQKRLAPKEEDDDEAAGGVFLNLTGIF